MTAINMQGRVRMKDVNEDVVSLAVYFQDDDSNTILDLIDSFYVFVGHLDAVTDALMEANEVTVQPALPGGLKSVVGTQPIASGELATYAIDSVRSFGVYTPALNRTFITNGIPQATGANATYLGDWLTAFGPDSITLLSNLFAPLVSLRKLGLRSRKHRRVQARGNTTIEPG